MGAGHEDERAHQTTVSLFFLDKDIDDVLGRRARSEHVVYTEHYSVENYLFLHGDLVQCLVAASTLDHATAVGQVGNDSRAWAHAAADNWKEWIVYCLFVRLQDVQNAPNYSVTRSLLHGAPYSPVTAGDKTRLLSLARGRLGMAQGGFDQAYERIERRVDRLRRQGRYDSVFPGKWYFGFLIADAKAAAVGRRIREHHLAPSLTSCLVLGLDYRGQWAQRFHAALERAADSVLGRDGPQLG